MVKCATTRYNSYNKVLSDYKFYVQDCTLFHYFFRFAQPDKSHTAALFRMYLKIVVSQWIAYFTLMDHPKKQI
jgi:hypothetical protein